MKSWKKGERAAEAVESLDLVRHGKQDSEPEVLKTEMGMTWKTALPGLGVLGALGAASWYLKKHARQRQARMDEAIDEA